MARSVVLKPSPRCGGCSLSPRWCICAGLRPIACPLQIDVLMHPRERWRPSSTGHLINRTIAGSRRHLWRRDRSLKAEEVRMPGRELLILHPAGEPLKAAEVASEKVQFLLVDGAWKEATMMAQETRSWGRLVSLPMSGESRYWLRAQQEGGRFSTVEALMFLLAALDLHETADELRLQFELHVYAGLRARGSKESAEKFLVDSPLRAARADVLEQLHVRRPR